MLRLEPLVKVVYRRSKSWPSSHVLAPGESLVVAVLPPLYNAAQLK